MNLKEIKPSLLKSLIAKSIHLLMIFSYLTLTLAPNYALATQTEPEDQLGRSTTVPHYKIRVTPVEDQQPFVRVTRKLGEETTDLTPQVLAHSHPNSSFTTLIEGLGNLTVFRNGTLALNQDGMKYITPSLSVKSLKPLNLLRVNLKHLKSNTSVIIHSLNRLEKISFQAAEHQVEQPFLLHIPPKSHVFMQSLLMPEGHALIAGSLLSNGPHPFKIDAPSSTWWIKPSGKISAQENGEGSLKNLYNLGSISLSALKVGGGRNQGTMSTTMLSVDNGTMVNAGDACINSLSGSGSFKNHADFKGLTHLKIRHFHNQVKKRGNITPDVSSGVATSTTLEVGPEVETFVNSKGAQITYSSLNFLASGTERNLPAFHNQGNVTVHYSFHSHNRNIINDGYFSVRGPVLEEGVTLHNNLTGTLILKDGINTFETGSIFNEGKVQSYQTLKNNGLRHLGINQGTWIHSGDVVPADKNKGYEIKGRVHLKGGNLIPDHFRTGESIVFHNQGHLTLDLVMYPPFFDSFERPTLSLINHGKLTLYPTILVPIETENTGHLRLYLRIEDEGFFHSQLFRRFVSPGRFTIVTNHWTLPRQHFLGRVSALEKLMGIEESEAQGLKLHVKASLKKSASQDTPIYSLKAFWQKGQFQHLLWKQTLPVPQEDKTSFLSRGILKGIGRYTFDHQGNFSLTNRKQSKPLSYTVRLTMPGAVALQDLHLPQLEVTARTVSFDDSIKVTDLTLTPLDPTLETPFCRFAPSAVVQSNQVALNGGLSQNFGLITPTHHSLTVALNQGQLENHGSLQADNHQIGQINFKGQGQFINFNPSCA